MVEIGLRQIKRIKDVVPLAARYELSRRLPLSLKKNLESEISANWAITRAFCLPADLQGLIRINLKGRERLGIIKQGKEYDKLCARIEGGLKTYADVNTGKPIVEKVIRTSQHFTEGPHLKDLPDIIVRWVSTPAATQQTIISPEYGSIAWPAKGRNPDGRSGNHRANGFLLIAGKSLKLNTEIETPHILDLAPTVLAMFNIPKPSEMHGNNLLIAQ